VTHNIKQGTSGGWRNWLARWWGRRNAGPAHLQSGEWGEDCACAHLRKAGLRILGRRVRVGRRDEVDILARDGDTLVFVEVKTRADESFGRPSQSVDREKRRNLSRAALRYMKAMRSPPPYFRFDIVEVIGTAATGLRDLRHHANAFTVSAPYHVPW
jgi:putative endonuclease